MLRDAEKAYAKKTVPSVEISPRPAAINTFQKSHESTTPVNSPLPSASESIPYSREPMDDIADGVASGTNTVIGDPLIVLAASMQSIAHSMRIMARATQHNTNLNTQIAQSVNDAARSAKQAVEVSTRIADAVTLLAHDYRLVHSHNDYEDGHVEDEDDDGSQYPSLLD